MLQADDEDDLLEERMKSPFGSSFRTFNATDYKPIGECQSNWGGFPDTKPQLSKGVTAPRDLKPKLQDIFWTARVLFARVGSQQYQEIIRYCVNFLESYALISGAKAQSAPSSLHM